MNSLAEITANKDKAVIYLRVSTEEQTDNYSLDTQADICRKEAERKGFKVLEIFREEGRSAKTIRNRPTLIEMLEFCRKNRRQIGAVIVYRLDRISRQTADYLAIRKKLAEAGVALISASEPTGDTPTERFIETMLAGFAQMDNDVRGERARNGMKARFMSGLYNGNVPLGYSSQNGYAVKDPEVFQIIKEAWDLMATGTKSLRDMAEHLNTKGIRDKGSPIYPQTCNRIFRNKFYAGKVLSKKYGLEVQGQHVPMITEELYYRVQAILDGRNRQKAPSLARRNQSNGDFPLRRIVRCSRCGTAFTGAWSKGKKARYGYYFCRKRCIGVSIPVEEVEGTTTEMLKKISLKPESVKLINAFLRRTYFERLSALRQKRDHSDIELRQIYTTRQALIDKNISGVYSDEVFKEQNNLLEERIKSIQAAKDEAAIEKYNLEAIAKFIEDKFQKLDETIAESTLDCKRTLLCSIFPEGLAWSYPGYSNTQLSPFYQGLLDVQNPKVLLGTRGRI